MHSRSRLQSPNEWTASCIEVSEFMQFFGVVIHVRFNATAHRNIIASVTSFFS